MRKQRNRWDSRRAALAAQGAWGCVWKTTRLN
jgi:hypothetical protein